jgi:hypothetical protein
MPRACPHGLMQPKRKEIKDAFEIFDMDNSSSGSWITESSLIQLVISCLSFLVMQFDSWVCSILRVQILYAGHTPCTPSIRLRMPPAMHACLWTLLGINYNRSRRLLVCPKHPFCTDMSLVYRHLFSLSMSLVTGTSSEAPQNPCINRALPTSNKHKFSLSII